MINLKRNPKSAQSTASNLLNKSEPTNAEINALVNINESTTAYILDPSKVTVEYFKQHPLRRLSKKKLETVQSWINQKISQDPSNVECYVIFKFLRFLKVHLSKLTNFQMRLEPIERNIAKRKGISRGIYFSKKS